MIEYRRGDLIEAFKRGDFHVIAHQANCFNTMGSGIAKQIRAEFPEAYEADCATVKGDASKLGGLTMCINNFGIIFNLYGQYNYGADPMQVYTKIDSLEEALANLRFMLIEFDYDGKIGLPKLGCGRGGESWDRVEPLVQSILGNDWHVIVYEL